MQRIVINTTVGGFTVGRKALLRLRELDCKEANIYTPGELKDEECNSYTLDIRRDDPLLIKVVEELGGEIAGGAYCVLKIIEIPSKIGWTIEVHEDGTEHIAEKHRTWS